MNTIKRQLDLYKRGFLQFYDQDKALRTGRLVSMSANGLCLFDCFGEFYRSNCIR